MIYAPNYLPATRYGGPVRSSHGLAKGLAMLGHYVDVVTTNVNGSRVLDVPLNRRVDMDGVNVRYFATSAPRRIYRAPDMLRAIKAEIHTYDAVHTNGVFLWPGPAIAHAALRADVPLVISPRGMLVPEMIAGKSTLVKMAWIRLFERTCLARARAIHVTSTSEADGVIGLGLNLAPLSIIGNGVDPPKRWPTEQEIQAEWQGIPSGKRVAFLARLDWTKGLDLAIEAVRQCPGATLVIAGHDQIGLRSALENQLRRSDGTAAGRFVGPLDDNRKWALLVGADVLLAPSIKESFGMSVAEALCVGTPVICTPGVGAANIVRETEPGFVVPRNASALTSALHSALEDPSRLSGIGQSAKTVMTERYTWSAIAAEMVQTYMHANPAALEKTE